MHLVYLVLGSISARWDQSRMQTVVPVIAASAIAQPGPLPSCAFKKYDHITHRCRLYECAQYGFAAAVSCVCVCTFFRMKCIYPMSIGRPAAVFPVTNKRLKHAAARAKWKRPHTGVHNMHSKTHTHTHNHDHFWARRGLHG